LLLVTPPGLFEKIVPFLVGGASAVLLFGGRARSAGPAQPMDPLASIDAGRPRRPRLVGAGVFAVSVYGGYFGAAAGVLMLALLVTMLPETLVRANGLKNLLLGLANIVAAIGFAVFGPVSWQAVLPLAVGLLAGSWTGPAVARRIPSGPLRVGIALAGIALAVKLGRDAF
jgi:hypothetical protein